MKSKNIEINEKLELKFITVLMICATIISISVMYLPVTKPYFAGYNYISIGFLALVVGNIILTVMMIYATQYKKNMFYLFFMYVLLLIIIAIFECFIL